MDLLVYGFYGFIVLKFSLRLTNVTIKTLLLLLFLLNENGIVYNNRRNSFGGINALKNSIKYIFLIPVFFIFFSITTYSQQLDIIGQDLDISVQDLSIIGQDLGILSNNPLTLPQVNHLPQGNISPSYKIISSKVEDGYLLHEPIIEEITLVKKLTIKLKSVPFSTYLFIFIIFMLLLAIILLIKYTNKSSKPKTLSIIYTPQILKNKETTTGPSPFTLDFPDIKKCYPLNLGNISLGASKANDITLDIPTISGKHAEFYVTNSKCHVLDLNSTNGTLVNGKTIKESIPLNVGDEILFGNVKAIFLLIKQ
jgi:hypothetical protein